MLGLKVLKPPETSLYQSPITPHSLIAMHHIRHTGYNYLSQVLNPNYKLQRLTQALHSLKELQLIGTLKQKEMRVFPTDTHTHSVQEI